jgi:hypothetical protein
MNHRERYYDIHHEHFRNCPIPIFHFQPYSHLLSESVDKYRNGTIRTVKRHRVKLKLFFLTKTSVDEKSTCAWFAPSCSSLSTRQCFATFLHGCSLFNGYHMIYHITTR